MKEAIELYNQIIEITSHKSDAEVRMDRDGKLVVFEVKKKKYKAN